MRIAERLGRWLLVFGVAAVAIMLVAPSIAATEAVEPDFTEAVLVDHSLPWDAPSSEDSAWANSSLMLAPLYLRIPEPQLLNSSMRSEIFTHVSMNPGATFSEIRATVGAASGTVQHHLRVLVRGGVLRRVRTGKYTRYYPCNHRVLALPPTQEKLVRSLAAEGPGTKAELAKRMGMSRQLVHYHVEKMADAGLVRVNRDGNKPIVRLGMPPLSGN